jgi:integrase
VAGKNYRTPRIQLSRRAILLLTAREGRRLKSAARYAQATPRPYRILVRDLFEAVSRDYEMNRRKSLAELKIHWHLHLAPVFGELPVASLSIADINAYIAARQQAKAANGTINRELATLRRCFTLGIQTGVLKFGARPYFPTLKENNVRKGHLSDAQYAKLARSTREIGVWLRALFEVGFTFGWRKSECLTRRVRHADFEERTLSLDPGETKNDEPRTVYMTSGVFELIKECCAGKGPEDYIFTRPHDHRGRKVRSNRVVDFRDDWSLACCVAGVGKMICKACRKAGDLVTVSESPCPKCGKKCNFTARGRDEDLAYVGLMFHDLRRTGVTNMIRDGVSEKQAMSVSGHLTRSVFDRYHIVDPVQQSEIARRMERGASQRGIPAEPLQSPLQLGLPFGDNPPRKPANRERLAICREPGCGERLYLSNESGYCRAHTIQASRKLMNAKARRCQHQGEGCLGEFNPTCPTQKFCKVCRKPAKRARARARNADSSARKPVGSDRGQRPQARMVK